MELYTELALIMMSTVFAINSFEVKQVFGVDFLILNGVLIKLAQEYYFSLPVISALAATLLASFALMLKNNVISIKRNHTKLVDLLILLIMINVNIKYSYIYGAKLFQYLILNGYLH